VRKGDKVENVSSHGTISYLEMIQILNVTCVKFSLIVDRLSNVTTYELDKQRGNFKWS
jgi:uncharacterized protein Smg (DUF494 family)